tara:strand:+ start:197 stop:484 length:288 start_codon:yes stop_codon:yes gene_type:complete
MSNKPIEINEDCQFMQDLKNNNKMAIWNLIVIRGQLSLFSKGILPTTGWRLKDVKNYIGMNGNKHVLLEKVIKLQDVLKPNNNNNLSNKGGVNVK